MPTHEYELHILEIHAGTVYQVDEEYKLPDIYLGTLPSQEELQELHEENIGELTFEIEDPGGRYGSGCCLSIRIPSRDPARKPATASEWGWQTLAQITIPPESIGLLIAALQTVQWMRIAQQRGEMGIKSMPE